mgnify:CR=1 FL=1
MTRRDIAKEVSNNTTFTVSKAEDLVDAVLKAAAEGMVKDGDLIIRNFGRFRALDKSARVGRNPRNKEIFTVSARRVISFKASKNFKQYVDEGVSQ